MAVASGRLLKTIERMVSESFFREAIYLLDLIICRDGESVSLLLDKARIILEAHDPTLPVWEAECCLERAHEMDRNDPTPICLLGRFYAVLQPDAKRALYFDDVLRKVVAMKRRRLLTL